MDPVLNHSYPCRPGLGTVPPAWVIPVFSCLLVPKRPPVFPQRGSRGSLQEPKSLMLLPLLRVFRGLHGLLRVCEEPAEPCTARPPAAGLPPHPSPLFTALQSIGITASPQIHRTCSYLRLLPLPCIVKSAQMPPQ